MWARINERGAETGILAINTTETVSVVTETAELVIRFIDPSKLTSGCYPSPTTWAASGKSVPSVPLRTGAIWRWNV